MITQEHIDILVEKIKSGKKREVINEELIAEGWTEREINEAVFELQRLSLLEIPVISAFIIRLENLQTKINSLPLKWKLVIVGCIIVVLVASIYLMNIIFDPLGQGGVVRDKQRIDATTQITTALDKFYRQNNSAYPVSLDKLVPQYLNSVPVDPLTGASYPYHLINGYKDYELCIDFEQDHVQCVSSQSYAIAPSGTPSIIPMPTVYQYTSYIVSGSVFKDLNENQIMDSGEAGVGGIEVLVRDSTSTLACQTLTDSSGAFTCNVYKSGNYNIFITIPDSYRIISPNPISIIIKPNSENSSNKPAYYQFGIIPITKMPSKAT